MREVVRTRSEAETMRVAAGLAAALPPGAIVLLSGDLGAGKTAFVRGMAVGLGIDPAEVSSPTFTLIQEYRVGVGESVPVRRDSDPTPRVLCHVDLYRLEGAEIDDLGLEELTTAGGVVAIEWAEKLGSPPPGAVSVTIRDLGGDEREIGIVAAGV